MARVCCGLGATNVFDFQDGLREVAFGGIGDFRCHDTPRIA